MSKPLTICIPTNRDLNNSKQSIFSAISFSENDDTNLIISDNSNDSNKKQVLEEINLPFLKCIFNGPEIAIENWWNAVKESKSSKVSLSLFLGIILSTKPFSNKNSER